MPKITFTDNIQRHINCPPTQTPGNTVRETLDNLFNQQNRAARNYILDDQNALRKHINIFLDGKPLRDRINLSDPVKPNTEIYIIQALSGG